MSITAPVRRRAKGERRIAGLLEAAASVFAEQGFDKATTNAVAERAGVSPGTFYQFFASKEALAEALIAAWSDEVTAAHDHAFAPEAAGAPLEALVARVADTLLDLHRRRPALRVLLHGPEGPPALARLAAPLHAAVLDRVSRLIAARRPDAREAETRRIAVVVVQLFKGLLPLALQGDHAMEAELRRALLGYLRLVEAA